MNVSFLSILVIPQTFIYAMIYKFSITILLFSVFNVQLFAQKNKLIPCQKGWDYYCFCDSTGKIVLDKKWEYVSKFDHGFAYVQNKKRAGYIDSTGKFESNCSYKYMGRFHKGYTWAWSYKEKEEIGVINIINTKCEIKFSKTHNYGEHGAALFDSIIVIYALNDIDECGNSSFGAIDYNFNIVIPFNYINMLKSSSDRYYLVSKSYSDKENKERCPTLWGIYDIVDRKEIVPCSYKGSLGGTINRDLKASTYSLKCEDAFFKEMEKLKISLPPTDEISEQINGIFKW